MENQTSNPLSNYFRQPAIYLSLPSQGRWWMPGSIDVSPNNEIAIYPMSTKDEILLRTPDALLNGQGVIDVIQSCCPAIKDAWQTPLVDVDAILISIRIASYGNNMDFESECPHCKSLNNHEVSLGNILSNIKCPDYSKPMLYKDLKIRLKPQSYFYINKSNMSEFNEQKLSTILSDTSLDDQEKSKRLAAIVTKVYNLGIDLCVNNTEYIELANGDRVTAADHISEFYHNADSALVNSLREYVNQIIAQAKLDPMDLQCGECTKQYKVDFSFDYSNFFVKGY
jgi:hypothetical protein